MRFVVGIVALLMAGYGFIDTARATTVFQEIAGILLFGFGVLGLAAAGIMEAVERGNRTLKLLHRHVRNDPAADAKEDRY